MPLPHAKAVLPLLSFGTGAADAFAFTAMSGIFTANMTGNAVLATIFTRADYTGTLAGAGVAIVSFAAALFAGFRVTRRHAGNPAAHRQTLVALGLSMACLLLVALMWWFAVHSRAVLLAMIAASAAGMALQTVAAKRDGVQHGATTTYLTGTLTDVVEDIVVGAIPWWSSRWLPLVALPAGAVIAVGVGQVLPAFTPLLPLAASALAMAVIAHSHAADAR